MATATDTTYNGWPNYATWRVNIEVFDGLDVREYFGGEVPEAYDAAQWAREHAQEIVYNSLDDTGGGVAEGWALAFLQEVEWHAIARHLVEYAADCAQSEAA